MTEEIIKRIRKGDQEAFRSVVEEYTAFALSLAFRLTSNRDEAADIVQESWLKVWERRKQLGQSGSFRAWLYKLVVNRCYDYLRKIKRRGERSLPGNDTVMEKLAGSYESDTELNLEEAGSLLRKLTEQLSPKQRAVFTLVELEGLEHDEVVKITGLTRSSVKSNLSHAKGKLRKEFEKHYNYEL